jgi:hypothetical protein
MNVPHGRLLALQYREAAFYTGDGRVGSLDVVRVHFRTPDDEVHHHDLPNGQWAINNAALQFMAKWGYQPTALDGTYHDLEDEFQLIPVARNPQEGDWLLHQAAMNGAQEALKEAEWFDPDLGGNGDSDGPDGPGGAPGPDPGTGNRGAVDDAEQGGVSAEMAGEESDAGVTVNVS